MTSNFDTREFSGQDSTREMDSQQRDRFELLSAFIDGEVTSAERKQVQQLLATDPQMQRLHSRLMKLRQELQHLPVPAAEATAQKTAQQVFSRIDRRRIRNTAVWGGAAVAAVFVSALSGIFPGSQSFSPQLAQSPKQEAAPEPLMIAVNRPIIEITKAPVASPQQSLETPRIQNDTDQSNFN